MLTSIADIYDTLEEMHLEITCSEEGEEWFWRDVDTGEEGQHAYANADEAALAAAEEFGIEHDINLNDGDDYYDDSMDGDHASALASVGWGTDEDYGSFSDDGSDRF